MVEVKLLEHLRDNDRENKKNIVRIKEYFHFRNHLWIVFEMLSLNLYDFIKDNQYRGFSVPLTRRFAIQILISLIYMKEHKIVHWDLKPENILLRKINKTGIKLIDFGSSWFEQEKIYSYIQSRFYRAPEIILGIPYTTAIDMWSFGWILYELFSGYPLFAGENENEQLQWIMELRGVPPLSVLALAPRRKNFFDNNYKPILVENSRGKIRTPGKKNLKDLMNWEDEAFVDFISKCIEWKVEDRMTPENAQQHEWIREGLREIAQENMRQQNNSTNAETQG